MPWFRIDDHFHHHPKVTRAGNAAVGLWVRAGSYSSAYLTDGHVPLGAVREMGTKREIDALVEARLWVPNGDGFVLPDFAEYNYSAEQVLAERAKTRARTAKYRASHNGDVTP